MAGASGRKLTDLKSKKEGERPEKKRMGWHRASKSRDFKTFRQRSSARVVLVWGAILVSRDEKAERDRGLWAPRGKWLLGCGGSAYARILNGERDARTARKRLTCSGAHPHHIRGWLKNNDWGPQAKGLWRKTSGVFWGGIFRGIRQVGAKTRSRGAFQKEGPTKGR